MTDSTHYLTSEVVWKSAHAGDNYYRVALEGGPLDGATVTISDPNPARQEYPLLMRPLWILGRPTDGWTSYANRYRVDLITRTATWED